MLNGETVNRSKSRKYAVFMFLIFIVATLMVLLWAYNIFQTSVSTTGDNKDSTSCWSYSYEIKDIKYANNVLSFNIENKFYSDARISNINIITQDGKTEKTFPEISKGNFREIIIEDIKVGDSFVAYPANCVSISKQYFINT